MIPIFGTDVEVEPIVKFLGVTPSKYGMTSEGLGVGGAILDSARYRDSHTYWSAIPIGAGDGTDSRIQLRYWKNGIWNFEKSVDAVFLDSAKILRTVIAFNRINEIFIVTEDPEGVSLSWIDPRVGGQRQTRAWVGATSPVLVYDAYTSIRHPDAQVILFYVKDKKLLMRLEQESFEIERDTGVSTGVDILETGAMTTTGKVQLLFGKDNTVPVYIVPEWGLRCSGVGTGEEVSFAQFMVPSQKNFKIVGRFTFKPNTQLMTSTLRSDCYIFLTGTGGIILKWDDKELLLESTFSEDEIIDLQIQRTNTSQIIMTANGETISGGIYKSAEFNRWGANRPFSDTYRYTGLLLGTWVFECETTETRNYDFDLSGRSKTGSGQPVVIETTGSRPNGAGISMSTDDSNWFLLNAPKDGDPVIDPNRVGLDLTGTVIGITNAAETHRYAGVKLDGAIGKQVFTKVSRADSVNNSDENLDIVGTPFDIFLNNGVVDASGWNGVYVRMTVVNLSTDKTVTPTMNMNSNFVRGKYYPNLQSDLTSQIKNYTSVGEFHTLDTASLNAAVLTSINEGFKLAVTFHFSDKPVPSEVDIFKLGTYFLDIETNVVIDPNVPVDPPPPVVDPNKWELQMAENGYLQFDRSHIGATDDFDLKGTFTYQANQMILGSASDDTQDERTWFYCHNDGQGNQLVLKNKTGQFKIDCNIPTGSVVEIFILRRGNTIAAIIKGDDSNYATSHNGEYFFDLFGKTNQFPDLYHYTGKLRGVWQLTNHANNVMDRYWDFNTSGDAKTGAGQPVVLENIGGKHAVGVGLSDNDTNWMLI
ncbi:hypothetical protein COPG_00048 [Colwellia phage 9A]|uniref:Uncharacterized protein n=1 Tax=Colwellia phage 9A TaxID=765765 RepID=I3UMC9_9CAUD|nr:hypothetical protein COPG_00048 [Colwellia phage 9A]AFK66644.1 hypothetical protein COPG_00048 [Colwellia phage 9A]